MWLLGDGGMLVFFCIFVMLVCWHVGMFFVCLVCWCVGMCWRVHNFNVKSLLFIPIFSLYLTLLRSNQLELSTAGKDISREGFHFFHLFHLFHFLKLFIVNSHNR